MSDENKRWAVVTGASSGIGAAIAAELAGRRWNIVLIGRDVAALDAAAHALTTRHGVETWTISADLATSAGIENVIGALNARALPVGALINNAGFGLHAGFLDTSAADETRLLDVQLKALLALTRAVLPGMLARRDGYILNVASVYAFSPVPNQAVYAACKAFMASFSKSLALELEGSGVSVSALCPGITTTAFRARAGMKEKKSAFALSAEAVARSGVAGMLRRRSVIVPGWFNRLYVSLPTSILGSFTRWFNKRRGIAAETR
jgi:short-subunit dehydrogenase